MSESAPYIDSLPRAWDIYAEQLFPLGYGHPLWSPGNIRLGDVGYLAEGQFHNLFNTVKKPSDPSKVPQGYEDFGNPNIVGTTNRITLPLLYSEGVQLVDVEAATINDRYASCP